MNYNSAKLNHLINKMVEECVKMELIAKQPTNKLQELHQTTESLIVGIVYVSSSFQLFVLEARKQRLLTESEGVSTVVDDIKEAALRSGASLAILMPTGAAYEDEIPIKEIKAIHADTIGQVAKLSKQIKQLASCWR